MAKYECCGLVYASPKVLTEHMRADHQVGEFAVAMSCCGTAFAESAELSEHMKAKHGIKMKVEV
ncbi:MAG: hypothetical protein OK456_01375 [Thaumarchaeota archaeon]|nr:hypothetical protein [Nitrososphaerota archaeon]